MKTIIGLLFIIFIVLAFCSPFATIWAVNTLFGLAIPITWKTYLAALFLTMVFSGKPHTSKAS